MECQTSKILQKPLFQFFLQVILFLVPSEVMLSKSAAQALSKSLKKSIDQYLIIDLFYLILFQWSPVIPTLQGRNEIPRARWPVRLEKQWARFDWETLHQWMRQKRDGGRYLTSTSGLYMYYMYVCVSTHALSISLIHTHTPTYVQACIYTHIQTTHTNGKGKNKIQYIQLCIHKILDDNEQLSLVYVFPLPLF